MIPIEKLKQVTHVYTHAHCPDGMASAMILKDAFRMLGTSPQIEFLVHGTPEHRLAGWGDGMFALFCDIAPHPEAVEGRMVGQFSGPLREMPGIVLDHHVGARDIVEAFGENGVYADAEKEPGVSGAVLAFREVWHPINMETHTTQLGQEKVQDFALSVGARDTWQTKDPRFMHGQYISKMLMSKPASHWLGVPFSSESNRKGGWYYLTDEEIACGRALFESHEHAVAQAVEQCVHYTVEGHGLFVFQEQACGFRLCSDVAEAIRGDQKLPLAPARGRVVAGFSYVVDKPGGEPKLVYSLRGLNGFDVCALAKTNGGGGHKAAAGFSVVLDGRSATPSEAGPYEYVRRRLEAFLNGGVKQ